MLSIIADSAIPLTREILQSVASVTQLPDHAITQQRIKEADALLVRSVTRVNSHLLNNTSIKFVGTATSGIDHLDIDYLQQNNIHWACSFGANAQAVSEYVTCCTALLQEQGILPKHNCRCGVIGVGHIGSKVVDSLKAIGAQVLANDPPKARREKSFSSTALEHLKDCDLITLHVPLHYQAEDATFHLIDDKQLSQQKSGVLINTSRGEVIDSAALKQQQHMTLCLDVWENEPNIDNSLLDYAHIATPHIAGYGANAKQQASIMICQELLDFFNLPLIYDTSKQNTAEVTPLNVDSQQNWQQVVLSVYNPEHDTQQLKQSQAFSTLRNRYQLRHAFSDQRLIGIEKLSHYDQSVLKKLSFKV